MPGKVLLYDDDEDILDVTRYILESMDFTVISQSSCSTILTDIEQHHPDLIILDNWIPDIGGVGATKLIKQNPAYNTIPVILFSASNNLAGLTREAGADGFLKKPFDIREIQLLVTSLLKKSEQHS